MFAVSSRADDMQISDNPPSRVGDFPSDVGAIPSNVGALPTNVGDVPSSVGTLPTSVGDFPTDNFIKKYCFGEWEYGYFCLHLCC